MTVPPILSEEVEAHGATVIRTDVAVDTIGTIVLTPAGRRLGMGERAAQLAVDRAARVLERAGRIDEPKPTPIGPGL